MLALLEKFCQFADKDEAEDDDEFEDEEEEDCDQMSDGEKVIDLDQLATFGWHFLSQNKKIIIQR